MKYADYSKLSKEEKAKVPFKEVPTANKVAMGFFFSCILLLAVVFFATSSDAEELPAVSFSQMTTEQKAAWITEYQNSFESEVTLFQMHIQDRIKNEFKFPEEVEIIDETTILNTSKIKDAATGECFNNGYCTAKNAFGVKSRYYWEVNYTLTDSLKKVNEVNIMPI